MYREVKSPFIKALEISSARMTMFAFVVFQVQRSKAKVHMIMDDTALSRKERSVSSKS